MIYFVFLRMLRVTVRIFFRHIHVSNVDKVPYDKPLVIAANHPGAFLDPIIIACFIKKPIYFLVRGDVFKNKLVRLIFEQFHMIPVYRKDEGFENIEKNHDTNAKVANILKQNGIVVIFSEGYSAIDRRLRTILKGTARICMQTAMSENLDVQILPAGITYTHKTNYRREVILDFSAPIAMRDFQESFETHPQKSFVSITNELKNRLHHNFVEIRNPECDVLTELHLNYLRNEQRAPTIPVVTRNGKVLEHERKISDAINLLYENDLPAYEQLEKLTMTYQKKLVEAHCTDSGVVSKLPWLLSFFGLVLGFPIMVLGAICWGIPYHLSCMVANKKVTRIDFYDSVTVNFTNVFFFILISIITIIGTCYFGYYALLLVIIIPAMSTVGIWYLDVLKRIMEVFQAAPVKDSLLDRRKHLVQLIDTRE